MVKAKFIAFEGIDGCGKSTQIKLLSNYLLANNTPFILTREPGGTALAEQLRSILKSYPEKLSFNCEFLLFCAARTHHVETVIKPALEKGITVLCDRYYLSSLVYQELTTRYSNTTLKELEQVAFSALIPDHTFVFDISLETCLNRIATRGEAGDRFEVKERLIKALTAYKTIVQYPNSSAPIHHINGEQEPDLIHRAVLQQL